MKVNIGQIIEYECESYKVDFKQEEYALGKSRKKFELLKDICAFANHLSDDDKFIIVGVKDIDGINKEVLNIQLPTDEAKYQQFICENIEPKVNFEYKAYNYNGKTICYFRIFNNIDRPYLFKKDLVNPENNKIDYKYGDGFIRIGTTSKKIGRKELDDINKNKERYLDRKNDLDILPIIGNPSAEDLRHMNVKYLDIQVQNKSNKSVDFDIEMILFKEKGFALLSELDLRKELREQRQRRSISPFLEDYETLMGDKSIDIAQTDTEIIVSRNPLKNKTALTLPQRSTLRDIFHQNIILIQDEEHRIRAEVTIRSDEFIDGPLIKEIVFET